MQSACYKNSIFAIPETAWGILIVLISRPEFVARDYDFSLRLADSIPNSQKQGLQKSAPACFPH